MSSDVIVSSTAPAHGSPTGPEVPDALARIVADKRLETAKRRAAQSADAVRSRALAAPPPRGFGRALMEAAAAGKPALIAEIKKASPSGGLIRADFDPSDLARAYVAGGATCLSVLTDEPYFQGTVGHLRECSASVGLPVLRKDFILEAWQVFESRALGADCILLIMAALNDEQAVELEEVARGLDMDVLVEVHDRAELDRALGLQTKLVGINNRNLKTLQTHLEVTIELAPHVPPDRFLIAESGIRTHEDLERLRAAGVSAFLVGESLMRQPDVEAATRMLLTGGGLAA